jgi:hypothetical protein
VIQLGAIVGLVASHCEMSVAFAMVGSFHGRPPVGWYGRASEPTYYRMAWPPANNAERSLAHDF